MRYQVPQFIEVEDKIFGPLTLKQFIYLAGGGGVALLAFTLLPLYFAFLASLPFVVLSLALAFYKVNDRPFIEALEHAVLYFLGTKLYLWKQRPVEITQKNIATGKEGVGEVPVPALSESKLRDLAWSLNIKDRAKMGVIDPERPEPLV